MTGPEDGGRGGGRVAQKARTRAVIVDACRRLIRTGAPVGMPDVARAAGVSEPTCYRYFPDLVSLLQVALAGELKPPAEEMQPVAHSRDPVERVVHACRALLSGVLAHEGAVRAMIAGTITRPALARERPGLRFGLIDEALDPLVGEHLQLDAARLAELKHDLAAILSAEALLTLIDLAGLGPDEAVASLTRSAATVTRAAVGDCAGGLLPPR